ncbi:MAG: hypothetical protein KAJ62_11695 [Desulfobacteraceae bacterium]|nr:hypothetical protein [Desulfobacteraceae bacterium]
MNTFNESWANFVPTKKERRIKAFKDALIFTSLVVLHMAAVGVIWCGAIMWLSL